MLHHVLEDGISDIADEQIVLRVPIREQGGQRVRVFSYHRSTFVFSDTDVKIRVFSYQNKDFSYQDSCFQLPIMSIND